MHQDYRKMPASPNSIDSDDLSCDANLATQKNRGGVQWLSGFALRGVGKRGSARSKAKRLQCTTATCSQLRTRPPTPSAPPTRHNPPPPPPLDAPNPQDHST